MLLLDEGHCLRDHALQSCDAKTKRNIDAFKATSLLTLVQMVANGTGITILPEIIINSQFLKTTKIKIVQYENKQYFREIVMCWRLSSPRQNDFNALKKIFFENI